jgi:hypothetical protein
MADDKKHEDPAIKSGEVIRTPPLPLGPARTTKGRTLDRLLSMLSIWPFRNRAFAESLDTATKVIEKRTELEETIIKHGRTRGRLNDLEITLAQDRLQRRREFIEERGKFSVALNDSVLDGELMERRNKMKKEDLTIEEIEQKTRKAKAKKDFEDFTKPPPPPPEPPKKKTTRGRSAKQKAREEVLTKYEKEMARIDAMKKTDKAKATLRKAAEAEEGG